MKEPTWVKQVLEVFLRSVEWVSLKTPIHQVFSYCCKEIDGIWEVTISPWLCEILGGKHDGAIKSPAYEINLLPIMGKFDKVDYIGFDTDRLEASIEGKINDSFVVLVLKRLALQKTTTRKKINTLTGEVTKISNR